MTDAFDSYYLEFTKSLKQLATTSTSNKDEVDSLVGKSRDLLQLASIEARGITEDRSLRNELLEAVKDGKNQLEALHQVHLKGELLATPAAVVSVSSGSCRLQSNEDTLARQNETLERARKSMQETEEIGREVTGQLGENRDKLESTQSKVNELQSMTGRAGELLKSMSRPWWRR